MSKSDKHLSGWILAIDGGGSKIAIAARAINERPTLPTSLEGSRTWSFAGTGSAHPSNWTAAQQHLADAIRIVASELQSGEQALHHVLFALAGAGRCEDRERVLVWARSLPDLSTCASLECVADIEPMIDYCHGDAERFSIAIILGTGSIVAARSPNRDIVRAGGWGPNLGDECSGGALGLAALRKAVEWFDTGQGIERASRLVRLVVQQLTNSDEVGRSAQSSYRHDPPDLESLSRQPVDRESLSAKLIRTAADRAAAAAFAHLVIQLALESKDSEAWAVLRPQLEGLAWQIEQVIKRSMADHSTEMIEEFAVVLGGGLAGHHPLLREAIYAACRARGLQATNPIVVDPLLAVLRFAALQFDERGGAESSR